MKNRFQSGIAFLLLASGTASAQFSFTNSNTLLHSATGVAGSNANVRSGNAVTVCDMNNDGLDDICKLADGGDVTIEYQQPGGTFTYMYCGNMGASGAWAMCVGDVDRNGYKDVACGYGNSVRLMKVSATGATNVAALPNSSFFSQNMNFTDLNNDGWIDLFACDDVSYSKLWMNDGTGNYPSEAGNAVINFDITPGQNSGTSNDDSGNYGSVFTDFDNDGDIDLYIAKCRQSVSSSTDPRRIDVLFENNNGSFTNTASAHGVAIGDQDWTSAFGDIDNDGDFDLFLTKHDVTSRIYINNGGNVTPGATFAFGSMPMQSLFEDIDNDGWADLIITGDNDHRIYRNNGNGTFSDATPAALNGNNMLSFAAGDLNHDGKIDLYGSYGSTYNNPGTQDDIYWLNNVNNGNHFLTVVPVASNSNRDALGVRVFIYGAWGVQTREVRAGESYGTQNSGHLHFGLGNTTAIDSVVVNWPSGAQNVFVNPAADQFLLASETNQCALSNIIVTPNGSTNLCTGQTVTLSAPTGTGYTYLWSNGQTSQNIVVNSAGSYAVQVSSGAGCTTTSPSLQITMNADETPTLTASASDPIICQYDNFTLTSSPAASYLWNTGDTTQSINVTSSGSYSVTIQGACQTFTSAAYSVTVNAAPATPTGSDVYIPSPQTVTLTATGTNVVWYDMPAAGNVVANGNSFTTPVISQDTTFYAEDQANYPGANAGGGMIYHSGSNYSGSTTNAYLIFNVMNACTLNTVKVYTDTPGNRLIELRDNNGTVINSLMVNVPVDTTVITLDFPLAVGNGYQLGCNQAQNQSLLGTNSPRLKRSNSNVNYPYSVGSFIDITNSSQGGTVFYYFFDWSVSEASMVCSSPRLPLSVYLMTTGLNENSFSDHLSVYPNPAQTEVNIKAASNCAVQLVKVLDLSGKEVLSVSSENVKASQITTLSTSKLAKGAYIINVVRDGRVTTGKLMVN